MGWMGTSVPPPIGQSAHPFPVSIVWRQFERRRASPAAALPARPPSARPPARLRPALGQTVDWWGVGGLSVVGGVRTKREALRSGHGAAIRTTTLLDCWTCEAGGGRAEGGEGIDPPSGQSALTRGGSAARARLPGCNPAHRSWSCGGGGGGRGACVRPAAAVPVGGRRPSVGVEGWRISGARAARWWWRDEAWRGAGQVRRFVAVRGHPLHPTAQNEEIERGGTAWGRKAATDPFLPGRQRHGTMEWGCGWASGSRL